MAFDVTKFIAAHGEVTSAWNEDPAGYAKVYGTLENFALAHAAAWGSDAEKADIAAGNIIAPDGFVVDGTDLKVDAGYEGKSLEQVLMDKILKDYMPKDLEQDAANRAAAQKIVDDANKSLDDAIAVNKEALNGTQLARELKNADDTSAALAASATAAAQTRLNALDQRKAEMTAALQQRLGDRTTALDSQTQALRAGLAQLETERTAALKQLNDSRLAAAEDQVTGINQGLQSARDEIAAQSAQQGFVGGGSAMEDAALARATIGARQNAAEAIGGAKVANATDSRALTDAIAGKRFDITSNDASERRGISDQDSSDRYSLSDALSKSKVDVSDVLASDTQAASDAGTKMKAAYNDADYTRRLSASLVPATLAAQKINLIDLPGQVGNQGMARTLNTLNWFAVPGSANDVDTDTYLKTADTFGNSISNLGSGLASAGMNLAGSVNWANIFAKNGSTVTGSGGAPKTDAATSGLSTGIANSVSFCWVARAVYGENNPRWRQFRAWLISQAPEDLMDTYVIHGKTIAEKIRNEPEKCDAIRRTMDAILAGDVSAAPKKLHALLRAEIA